MAQYMHLNMPNGKFTKLKKNTSNGHLDPPSSLHMAYSTQVEARKYTLISIFNSTQANNSHGKPSLDS